MTSFLPAVKIESLIYNYDLDKYEEDSSYTFFIYMY